MPVRFGRSWPNAAMLKEWRRCVISFLVIAFVLIAIANWVTTIEELRRFYTNIPIWDPWDYLEHFARYKKGDWSVFWIQHNEHRTIATEILYAIDMLWFHGRQWLPTLAGVLTYVCSLWLFSLAALKSTRDRRLVSCAVVFAVGLAGYKLCVVSLTIPFLAQWTQVEFFSIAALLGISALSETGGRLSLCLALASAVAATYSMSNGMLIWPLLLVAGWLRELGWKRLLIIAAVGAVAVRVYFIGYENLHTFNPGVAAGHLFYALGFLGNFVGMPFSTAYQFENPWKGAVFGWIALAVLLVDIAIVVKRKNYASAAIIVLGGYCFFVIMSAIGVTVGRMDVGDPQFVAARAGRYITEPTLFWCALLLLTIWLLDQTGREWLALGALVAFGIVSIVTLPRSRYYYQAWVDYFRKGQWAAIAVANGVVDGEVSDVLFPDRNYVKQFQHVMEENRLAIFADKEHGWIGQSATRVFRAGPDGYIHGKITMVKQRGGDFEIQGWADRAETMVFTDDRYRILGFGLRPKAGPTEPYTKDVPFQFAFTGFIQGKFGAHEFFTWALDRRNQQTYRLGDLKTALRR